MKKILIILVSLIGTMIFVACGSKSEEIEVPEVTKLLADGGVELDYATYETTENNDEKSLKVTAVYNDEVMIVGKVVGIRNIIEQNFSNDYSKIDLTIMQNEPEFSSVNYIYEDGSWDKDVK